MSDKRVEPHFDPETGYVVLLLDKEDVELGEEAVTFEGKQFQPKDEVHITLVGSALGEELARAIKDQNSVGEKVQQLVDDVAWAYELRDAWYHVVEGESESIIRMADVPPLASFYEELSRLANVSIPDRPTHVTLYTFGDRDGIGVATQDEFDELVVGQVDPGRLT